jgi:colicin import membrane protein
LIKAVSGVQKKVEKSQSDSVNQAHRGAAKRRWRRPKQHAAGTDQSVRKATGAAGAGASQVGRDPVARRALELIDIYKIEVAFQVERQWAFSEQLAGDGRALQSSLVFRVLPSGEITDIRFTERSGNSYLDEVGLQGGRQGQPGITASPRGPGVVCDGGAQIYAPRHQIGVI